MPTCYEESQHGAEIEPGVFGRTLFPEGQDFLMFISLISSSQPATQPLKLHGDFRERNSVCCSVGSKLFIVFKQMKNGMESPPRYRIT